MMKQLKLLSVMGIMTLGSIAAHANSGPDAFSYEGRLYDTTTNAPSNHTVNLVLQILHPTPVTAGVYCVVREEKISNLNLALTGGYFSVAVGTGIRQGKDPGLSMLDAFVNKSGITGKRSDDGTSCAVPSTGGMARYLRVTIEDTYDSSVTTLSPDVGIGTTPYALTADSLQGFTPADLLAVNAASNLSQANLESVFTGANYAKLQNLLAGTSSQYTSSSGTTGTKLYAGSVSSPVAGSVWVEGSNLKFNDGSSTITLGASGNGTVQSIVTGTGLTGGPITAAGTISLDVSGVTAGTYGSSSYIPWFTADTYGRVIAAGSNALVVSASNISGGTLAQSVLPIVPVSKGGTNNPTALNNNRMVYTSGGAFTEAPALNNGEIFIGQGAGAPPLPATLTAGSGITITNGAGSITISATAGTLGIGAVGTAEIADGTVAAVDLASNAVTSSKIAANAVNWSHIQDDTVTFAKMQNVNSQKLVGRSSVGNGDIEEISLGSGLSLANGTLSASGSAVTGSALTSAQFWIGDGSNTAQPVSMYGDATMSNTGALVIGPGAISSAKLATSAVTQTQLAANAVTTVKIADDSVTFAKFQNINTGMLLGRATASSGDMEELSVGGGLKLAGGTLGVLIGSGLSITNGTLSAVGGGGDFYKDGSVSMTGALTLNGDPSAAQHAANKAYVDAADNSKLSLAGGSMTGQLLSVTGSTLAPGIAFSGDSNTGIASAGADAIMIVTGGSNTMWLGANSGVGIGTTIPLGALDVRGPLAISKNATNGVTFSPANVTLVQNYLLPSSMGGAGTVLTLGTGGTLSWQAAGSGDFMRNGSLSMTGQLQGFAGSAGLPGYSFGGDTDTGLFTPGANAVSLTTGGTERLRVTAAGLVGIGSAAPAEKLDVAGNVQASGFYRALNTGGYAFRHEDSNNLIYTSIYTDAVHAQFGTESAHDLGFTTNNLDRMLITAAGDVGVGTSVPLSRFDVRNGAISAGSQSSSLGGEVRFYEGGAGGLNYVAFRGSSSIAANMTWTLPTSDGSNGFALTTNGSGILSWSPIPGAFSVVGSTLTNGNFWMGNGSNQAQAVTMSGDASMSNTGVVTIGNNAITSGKLAANAVSATHLQNGAVSFAKIQNVNSGKLLGRSTAGLGDIEELSLGGGFVVSGGSVSVVSPVKDLAGAQNLSAGSGALASVTSGSNNTMLGTLAGRTMTTAFMNVGVGDMTLSSNVVGNGNVAIGSGALQNATSSYNVAIGMQAGNFVNTGQNNILIGKQAGGNTLTSGSGNILIGSMVDVGMGTLSNQLNIGNTVFGDMNSKRVAIGAAPSGLAKFEVSDAVGSGTYYGMKSYLDTTGGVGINLKGVSSDVNANGASSIVLSAFGFVTNTTTTSGNTINNLYGFYMGAPTGTGTVTNRYGMYLADPLARNLVAGSLVVGTMTNPAATIDAAIADTNAYSPMNGSLTSPTGGKGLLVRNSANTTNSGAFLGFQANNGSAATQKAYIGAISETGNAPTIVIGAQTNTSGYAERMRIDPAGNVGIGTSFPSSLLEVYGGNVKANMFQATGTGGGPGSGCSAGQAGTIGYHNGTTSMLFCDGSNWRLPGSTGGSTFSVDSSTTGNGCSASGVCLLGSVNPSAYMNVTIVTSGQSVNCIPMGMVNGQIMHLKISYTGAGSLSPFALNGTCSAGGAKVLGPGGMGSITTGSFGIYQLLWDQSSNGWIVETARP